MSLKAVQTTPHKMPPLKDANQVILIVLQCPLFAQAIIGLCNTAVAFSGTPADCARYLGSIGWNFADQANFPLLADQKGLYNALTAILDILDHWAAIDSTAIKSFFLFADAIIQTKNNCHELQCQCEAEGTKLNGKSKPNKVKVTPSVANYKSGGKTALLLLGQIDAILKANPIVNGHSLAPLKHLKKQHEVVELAAEQQLHLLDVSLQTYKLIMAHLSCLDKALSPVNIDLASLLLNMLNISFKV
ncbi:hypothetical protein C0989_005252 [Termitomyces sp. Mn162]|nr:hypothetical protein C0989_005252 [Termitomyces sp. Mn162]